MITMHDVVVNTVPLKDVPLNTTGTVVWIYTAKIFEVEFIVDGKSVITSVAIEQIKLKDEKF